MRPLRSYGRNCSSDPAQGAAVARLGAFVLTRSASLIANEVEQAICIDNVPHAAVAKVIDLDVRQFGFGPCHVPASRNGSIGSLRSVIHEQIETAFRARQYTQQIGR